MLVSLLAGWCVNTTPAVYRNAHDVLHHIRLRCLGLCIEVERSHLLEHRATCGSSAAHLHRDVLFLRVTIGHNRSERVLRDAVCASFTTQIVLVHGSDIRHATPQLYHVCHDIRFMYRFGLFRSPPQLANCTNANLQTTKHTQIQL